MATTLVGRLLTTAPLGKHPRTNNCDQKSTNNSNCESGFPGTLLPSPLLFRPLSFTFLPRPPPPHTHRISCFFQRMGLGHVYDDLDGHVSSVTKSHLLPQPLSSAPLLPCFTVKIQLRVKRAGTQKVAAGSTFAQPGRPLLSRKNLGSAICRGC